MLVTRVPTVSGVTRFISSLVFFFIVSPKLLLLNQAERRRLRWWSSGPRAARHRVARRIDFNFVKQSSIGLKLGLYFWRKPERGSDGVEGLAHGRSAAHIHQFSPVRVE